MGNIKLERLKKDDYSELVDILNRVFSAHNGRPIDFEKRFRRIFKPIDENMSWHLGAKADGKLCGVAASYPLVWKVGGEELNISAGGNIAVDENYRGKGVMGSLLNQLDKENTEDNFDIVYLHGDRFRYRNYGFEKCGVEYIFDVGASMLRNIALRKDLSYVDIRLQGDEFLKKVFDFHNTQKSYLVRNLKGFLDALASKDKTPVAVVAEDKSIEGYFCIDGQNAISEMHIRESELFAEIMNGYLINNGIKVVSISLPEYSPLFSQAMQYCRGYRIIQPANFKIMNFKKVVECFMRVKCEYDYLPDGELTMDSEVFGKWQIKKQGDSITVEEFSGEAQLKLSGYSAYEFIFGPSAPLCKGMDKESALLAKAWFPLPLFCPYLT